MIIEESMVIVDGRYLYLVAVAVLLGAGLLIAFFFRWTGVPAMNDLVVQLIWLGIGVTRLRPTRSRWSNILGGVLIGAGSMVLIEGYVPLFMQQQAWWAFQWFTVVCLIGFMTLLVMIGMIWVFERW